MTAIGTCAHLSAITTIKQPQRRVCDECVKIGGDRHATKHARASGHPVVASAEPGERWLYCYPDDAFAEY